MTQELEQAADLTHEGDKQPCMMCETFLEWLRQAWPESHLEELPEFLPREAKPIVKIHNEQAAAMPFCLECSRFFMAAMSQFHKERQAREGQEETALRARVEQQIVTPNKSIVLPGQPGFRA
jgi:hypothetical protein